MLLPDWIAPAFFWRAFSFYLGWTAVGFAAAGGNSPPPLAQFGKPDAAETAKIVDQFRRSGFSGYFEIELHTLPRRGPEVTFQGRLWGGRNEQGAVIRIELTDSGGKIRRLLLQNGERPEIWLYTDGTVSQPGPSLLFEPLIPGTDITPFDLQMPYLYWPAPVADHVTRMGSRPAYEIVFRPPPEFASLHPEIALVRSYFDAQFGAPTQTEVTGSKGVLRTLSLLDLKKVGEQYVPKALDFRNEQTRDKTRLLVTGVALEAKPTSAELDPSTLTREIKPPEGIVKLDKE